MDSNIVLGLDIGSASCGWALVDTEKGKVLEAGVRCFEEPKEDNGKKTYASIRGNKRRARRNVRRKKWRKTEVVKLLVKEKVLPQVSVKDLTKMSSELFSYKEELKEFESITYGEWNWNELKEQIGEKENQEDIERILHKVEEAFLNYYREKMFFEDQKKDTWDIRKEGLDRKLSSLEWARCLYHIANHRGFQSNRKEGRKVSDGAINTAISEFKERNESTGSRTVAEFVVNQDIQKSVNLEIEGTVAQQTSTKRNKRGQYNIFPIRDMMREEVDLLFESQKKWGNEKSGENFLKRYKNLAFEQLPLQSSAGLIGYCSLEGKESGQKRASKYTLTFEYFRFLEQLGKREYYDANTGEVLKKWSKDDLKEICQGIFFSKIPTKEVKAKTIEGEFKKLGFRFKVDRDIIDTEKETERPIAKLDSWVAYLKVFSKEGLNIKDFILEDWKSCLGKEDKEAIVDTISSILAVNEDSKQIKEEILSLDTELKSRHCPKSAKEIYDVLFEDVDSKNFLDFVAEIKHHANLSLKALRKIIPHMEKGLYYSEACEEEGYDYKSVEVSLDDVTNPLVIRIVTQVKKLIKTIIKEYQPQYGEFKKVHIEVAREAGTTESEKANTTKRNNQNENRKNKLIGKFQEDYGISLNRERDEMTKAQLWDDQGGHCVYCYRHGMSDWINPKELHRTEIEHVYPRSKTGNDNSYPNKVLSCVDCNREKGNRIPYDWFGDNEEEWKLYSISVKKMSRLSKEKKRRLLSKKLDEVDFISRQLNDKHYACRLLIGLLKSEVIDNKKEGLLTENQVQDEQFFQAISGGITSYLRRNWGLERLKKDVDGNRLEDDRNHAVDAMVVALCSVGMMQYSIEQIKNEKEDPRKKGVPLPRGWHSSEEYIKKKEDFFEYIKSKRDEVFVSRAPNRKARGQIHTETIYGKRERFSVIRIHDLKKEFTQSSSENINSLWNLMIEKGWLTAWKGEGNYKVVLSKDGNAPTLSNTLKEVKTELKEMEFEEKKVKDFLEKVLAYTEYTKKVRIDEKFQQGYLEKIIDKETRNKHIYEAVKEYLYSTDKKEIKNQTKLPFYLDKKGRKNFISKVTLSEYPARVDTGRGYAGTGYLVRGDVFFKKSDKGKEYFVVPVYLDQVLNDEFPPQKTLRGIIVDNSFEFCFSLYPKDYFEVKKKNKDIKGGYFCGVDKNKVRCRQAHTFNPRIDVSIQTNVEVFEKYEVDCLGNKHLVGQEKRIWRGSEVNNN